MGKQGNKVAGGQSVLTWIVQISESIYFQIMNILNMIMQMETDVIWGNGFGE